jgi:hypothetical protein
MIQTDRSSAMTNTKSLMLAAVAALSLGLGTAAMAQDSAFFLEQDQQLHGRTAPLTVQPSVNGAPQSGSADRSDAISSWPVLQGGDGAGG